MASTYLTRTLGTPTNAKKYTLSMWIKRSGISSNNSLVNYDSGGTLNELIRFGSDDSFLWYHRTSGGTTYNLNTNRLFRDTNGFYHIVIEVDTTQATASDRVKIYINGSQETSFSTETYPAQNLDMEINKANTVDYFRSQNASSYFNGVASHVHFIDGTAYDATAFGEYDANGVWKAKTSPSVTYGTNGFFILKDSASVTDQSGNGNNFTVAGGTLTDTLDCSANVFATWNNLAGFALPNGGFSNGNTTATQSGNTSWTGAISNLGVNSGKYYCEIKWTSTSQYNIFGFIPSSEIDHLGALGQTGNTHYGLYYSGDLFVLENGSGSSVSSFSSAISSGDIVQLALDKDNNKMYWGINGTWQNSADPSAGTGGYSIGYLTDEYWHFAINQNANSGNATMQINFGNGYFGTTAVASAGTNASGIGIFEYDVPTGYTALSTKGLNL